MERPQPVYDAHQVLGVAELLAYRVRPLVNLTGDRGGVAACGDQRAAQTDLQRQFPPPPPWRLGQQDQQLQSLLQMRGGFGHGRASRRQPTGLLPVGDRLFKRARFGEMVREQVRFTFRDFRKAGFEHLADAGVEFLAPPVQQRAVGRVSDERVLEAVGRIRRSATFDHQPALTELRQTFDQVGFR